MQVQGWCHKVIAVRLIKQQRLGVAVPGGVSCFVTTWLHYTNVCCSIACSISYSSHALHSSRSPSHVRWARPWSNWPVYLTRMYAPPYTQQIATVSCSRLSLHVTARHLPQRMKSHRSHDIVLLCVDCHVAAQRTTEIVKQQVARCATVNMAVISSAAIAGYPLSYIISHQFLVLKVPHKASRI